MDIAQTFVRSI